MKNCDKCNIKDDCRYYHPCELGDKEPLKGDALKSIEERAKTSYLRSNVQGLTIASSHEVGYIQGATEQAEITKKEMIEKSCRTYCRFCPHQCENYPHDDCQIQIEFRKAMEG